MKSFSFWLLLQCFYFVLIHDFRFFTFFADMAQLITARLAKTDGQPWGFRLQGGKDFGTALTIQKVGF